MPERLDFEGNVVIPLDEEAVRRALRRMKRQGVESLAVVLLFSFVEPDARAPRARDRGGGAAGRHDLAVARGDAAAPEFERTSTTLVNAYVGPKIERYLSRLDARLREAGFRGELLIMQSNGGVMPGGYVAQKAVAVMGSGPAGGVMGATAVAGAAGVADFISVDMGGTSYDVCLVRDGDARGEVGLELAPSLPGRPADGRRARRSAPAAARSRASSRARSRSVRRAPAPSRARCATAAAASSRPSPTPTSCSAT